MKKALAIFTISLTLIIVGAVRSAYELTMWNFLDDPATYQRDEYHQDMLTIDIRDYNSQSINVMAQHNHHPYFNDLFQNFFDKVEYVVDKKQEVNKLTITFEYYSKFGKCELNSNEFHYYHHHKNRNNFLEISTSCQLLNRNLFKFLKNNDYGSIKEMLKNRKIPIKLLRLEVRVNPSDEYKIIKFY